MHNFSVKCHILDSLQDYSFIENVPYREAVGSLLYLVTISRPDIAYAVSQVAKFCEKPGKVHWNAVKREQLINELENHETGPVSLFCDNQSAIRLVRNPEFHNRTKHIDENSKLTRRST